jgi:hypothetical protein
MSTPTHVCKQYLAELACRAVSAATPVPLPMDSKSYDNCKLACVPLLGILATHPLLRAQLAAQSGFSEKEPERLAEYARHHPLDQATDVTEGELQRWIAKRNLKPMIDLLKINSPLQQRLAYALDYVPSRWLLGAEIPAVAARRRLVDPSAPSLEDSYKDLTDPSGHRNAYAWARENKLTGLCLSGGGIRSATFNLGVLQGLAALGVLGEFDYLSSVSGGGYIHEWLAAWIKREDVRSLADKPAGTKPRGFATVADSLRPLPVDAGHPFTPEPIRWLRRYSNYLTPRKGAFSPDTWVAIVIWLRNTFLNQIILISLLFTVMMLPEVLVRPLIWTWHPARQPWAWFMVAMLPFLFASVMLWKGLRHELLRVRRADIFGMPDPPVQPALLGEGEAVLLVVLPLLVAALLLTCALALGAARTPVVWGILGLVSLQLAGMAIAGGVIPAYCANHDLLKYLSCKTADGSERSPESKTRTARPELRWFFSGLWDCLRFWDVNRWNSNPAKRFREKWIVFWGPVLLGPLLGLTVLGSIFAGLGAAGVFWTAAALLHFPRFAVANLTFHLPVFLRLDSSDAWRTQLTLGPPMLMLAPFSGMVLMAGLVGRNFPDWLREWIARIRAWSLLLGFAWIALFGTVLFGPALVHWLGPVGHVYKKTVASIKWTAALGWIATTLGAVLAGKSKNVTGGDEDRSAVLKTLALIGPYVFLVGLLILLSSLADQAAMYCFISGEPWYQWALVLDEPVLPQSTHALLLRRVEYRARPQPPDRA